MSETDAWRGACESTNRDKRPASLHRIVRLSFHLLVLNFGDRSNRLKELCDVFDTIFFFDGDLAHLAI
jgi:hypothetical protein